MNADTYPKTLHLIPQESGCRVVALYAENLGSISVNAASWLWSSEEG